MVAITGSSGKTTTRRIVDAALGSVMKGSASPKSFNNDIGVPLTLLRLRAQHELAVVELGMNHPGEIAQLAAIAQPTVALVNNAQREHLEFMATVEAVAHAICPHLRRERCDWCSALEHRPCRTIAENAARAAIAAYEKVRGEKNDAR